MSVQEGLRDLALVALLLDSLAYATPDRQIVWTHVSVRSDGRGCVRTVEHLEPIVALNGAAEEVRLVRGKRLAAELLGLHIDCAAEETQ